MYKYRESVYILYILCVYQYRENVQYISYNIRIYKHRGSIWYIFIEDIYYLYISIERVNI